MGWSHIVLQCFCLYQSSKDKKNEFFTIEQSDDGELLYDNEGGFKSKSIGVVDNPLYIDAERPQFCKDKYDEGESDMIPHPDCWMNDCKFLATCSVENKESLIMVKAWEKASERGEFDHLESGTQDNGEIKDSSLFPNNELSE